MLSRLIRWQNNAEVLIECPHLSETYLYQAKHVPSLLHRIWECGDIPAKYMDALQTWIEKAHGIPVVLWTKTARERLISKLLGPKQLALYNRLTPGAYRADLFRYIVMFYFGGMYSDMDTSLHSYINWSDFFNGVTLAIDLDTTRILNGAVLLAPPKSPIFMCAMGEVFDHSERRQYFQSDLDISGPGVLGECLRHVLGFDDILFEHETALRLKDFGFNLLTSSLLPEDGKHVVHLSNRTVLLSLGQGGISYGRNVSPDCDPGEHYSKLFTKKQVYAPS
mmetsp:Transcript_9608/g.43586  ORF Transcript_9608/g.43586 Transcript_9608/m.43586 type:complete len:279 (-) Transcript_9608:2024-2860(-)